LQNHKIKSQKKVNANASIASLNQPIQTERCAHVTEKPETINTNVLYNGNSLAGITNSPSGGNTDPI